MSRVIDHSWPPLHSPPSPPASGHESYWHSVEQVPVRGVSHVQAPNLTTVRDSFLLVTLRNTGSSSTCMNANEINTLWPGDVLGSGSQLPRFSPAIYMVATLTSVGWTSLLLSWSDLRLSTSSADVDVDCHFVIPSWGALGGSKGRRTGKDSNLAAKVCPSQHVAVSGCSRLPTAPAETRASLLWGTAWRLHWPSSSSEENALLLLPRIPISDRWIDSDFRRCQHFPACSLPFGLTVTLNGT